VTPRFGVTPSARILHVGSDSGVAKTLVETGAIDYIADATGVPQCIEAMLASVSDRLVDAEEGGRASRHKP
jgi:hypothetical protein